jgi:hypothetical protein
VFVVQLMDYQEIIRKFYCSKYSGRRLHWQHSLGHCTLRAWFPKVNIHTHPYHIVPVLCQTQQSEFGLTGTERTLGFPLPNCRTASLQRF